MKSRILGPACVLLSILVGHVAFAAVILFNDGLVHTINDATFDMDDIDIQDSGGGFPTTVNLVAPGDIGESVTVSDTSIFNMSGGRVGTRIEAGGQSSVDISGGQIGDCVEATGHAFVNISGGDIGSEDSRFLDNSRLCMSGGGIEEVAVRNSAEALITGGFVEAVFTSQNGFVRFSGATLQNDVRARDTSNVKIFGGVLMSEDLVSEDTAVIDIFGSAFNLPFGDIAAMAGTLTGTLADGGPIDMEFQRDATARIVLHQRNAPFPNPECIVPVPAFSGWGLLAMAVLLLALGGVVLTRRRLAGISHRVS